MGNIDFYSAYIASPKWSEKRQNRLHIDGHKCQTCLHDGTQWRLEVHHKTYERLGDEDVEKDLITLCRQCHEAVTSIIRSRRYEGRPVEVTFFQEARVARKEACNGLEDTDFSDYRRRAADHAQRRPRKPVEQGR